MSLSFFCLLVHYCWPPDYPFSARHSVEVASTSMSVSTHAIKAQPIANLSLNWDADALCDNVHPIAGHAEEGRILCFEYGTWFFTFVNFGIELVRGVLKAHSIHQSTVKTVIQRLVNVVARFASLHSLSENSCQKVKTSRRKMSTWLSNDLKLEFIFLSWLKSLNSLI